MKPNLLILTSFFDHLFKAKKRSSQYSGKTIFRIFLFLFRILGLIILTILLLTINSILQYSGTEISLFLKNYLLLFFVLHLFVQVLSIKITTQNLKPYLLLNLKRSTIGNYIIILSAFSTVNLFFLLTGIVLTSNYLQTVNLEIFAININILYLLFLNNLFALYIKIYSSEYFIIKTVAILLSGLFIIKLISPSEFFLNLSFIFFEIFIDYTASICTFLIIADIMLFIITRKRVIYKLAYND
jgi:hypothetical protein